MAGILDSAEDDILVLNQILAKNGVNADFRANFSFPCPLDSFSSTALKSPIESVLSPGTETEVAEESLFAGLTRQLARSAIHETQKLATEEKTWILSGSPKSTLSALGSWAGTPTTGPSRKTSPSATPQGGPRDCWEVIYAAAAQVARLKMARERSKYLQIGGIRGRSVDLSSFPAKKPASVFYPDQIITHSAANQNLRHLHVMKEQIHQSQLQQQQIQCRVRAYRQENSMLLQSEFPLQQELHLPPHRRGYPANAVLHGGGSGGGRKESTGTGVFLPRRYVNTVESRKKPGYSVLLPSATNSPPQSCFNNNNKGPVPDYDSLMGRRHALFVEQQKRSIRSDMAVSSSEIRLPQEWTY